MYFLFSKFVAKCFATSAHFWVFKEYTSLKEPPDRGLLCFEAYRLVEGREVCDIIVVKNLTDEVSSEIYYIVSSLYRKGQ